jgi:biotin operon repressor
MNQIEEKVLQTINDNEWISLRALAKKLGIGLCKAIKLADRLESEGDIVSLPSMKQELFEQLNKLSEDDLRVTFRKADAKAVILLICIVLIPIAALLIPFGLGVANLVLPYLLLMAEMPMVYIVYRIYKLIRFTQQINGVIRYKSK